MKPCMKLFKQCMFHTCFLAMRANLNISFLMTRDCILCLVPQLCVHSEKHEYACMCKCMLMPCSQVTANFLGPWHAQRHELEHCLFHHPLAWAHPKLGHCNPNSVLVPGQVALDECYPCMNLKKLAHAMPHECMNACK